MRLDAAMVFNDNKLIDRTLYTTGIIVLYGWGADHRVSRHSPANASVPWPTARVTSTDWAKPLPST